MPRNALGRGLGALIREPEPVVPPTESRISGPVATAGGAAAAPAPEAASTGPQELDIDLIDPSPYQPRTRFREERDRANSHLRDSLVNEARARIKARETGWWWAAMDSLRRAAAMNMSGHRKRTRKTAHRAPIKR